MKSLHVSLLIGMLALVGCNRESPKGGAAGDKKVTTTTSSNDKTQTTTIKETENRDNQFSVKVPSGGTNVTQGKREEVTISLNRGDHFKQAVQLKFDTPQGVKVVPAKTTIPADDNSTKVFVEVAADASVGRHTITVTGVPESGKATSVPMDIDVKKKS